MNKYLIKCKILFFLSIFFNLTILKAKEISAIDFYRRCTIHLTGQPISITSDEYKKIKSGNLDPLQACYQLLNQASLGADGLLQKDTKVGRQILKTFLNFHRTWFSSNTLEQIQDYNEEIARGTVDAYDPNEPALALTYSLVDFKRKFSDVLTDDHGLLAIREEDEKVKNLLKYKVKSPSRRFYGNGIADDAKTSFRNKDSEWINNANLRKPESLVVMPFIQVGDLVGIRHNEQAFNVPNVDLQPLGRSRPGHLEVDLKYSFNFYQTQGGGVLGSPVFILMNFGHPLGLKANGSTKLPRRWIRNAMESFLCVNFPVLREKDIKTFYKQTSTAPFRTGNSCLQCHATLDQAATTARNVTLGATDYFAFDEGFFNKYPLIVTSYNSTQDPISEWSSEPVKNFHLQKPTGKLYFRTFSGELIEQPVQNISDLGKSITEIDDFYTCAAKRYFEYFTGINVPLYDRTDPVNAGLNKSLKSEDISYRLFIEKLGGELKNTQSLSQLIKSILNSDYYKQIDYRP